MGNTYFQNPFKYITTNRKGRSVIFLSSVSIFLCFTFSILDIDECTALPPMCHVSSQCTNTLGSFRCVCKHGYTYDGERCSGRGRAMPFNNIKYELLFFLKHLRGLNSKFKYLQPPSRITKRKLTCLFRTGDSEKTNLFSVFFQLFVCHFWYQNFFLT